MPQGIQFIGYSDFTVSPIDLVGLGLKPHVLRKINYKCLFFSSHCDPRTSFYGFQVLKGAVPVHSQHYKLLKKLNPNESLRE